MRRTSVERLEDGRPRYRIVSFHAKGKPPEHCVRDYTEGAWMMPRTPDMREAVSVCDLLSCPGDAPLVTVNRHDVNQLRMEVL